MTYEHRAGRRGEPGRDLEQQRRLADARLAGQQHDTRRGRDRRRARGRARRTPVGRACAASTSTSGMRCAGADTGPATTRARAPQRRRRPRRACPTPGTRRTGRPTAWSASRTRRTGTRPLERCRSSPCPQRYGLDSDRTTETAGAHADASAAAASSARRVRRVRRDARRTGAAAPRRQCRRARRTPPRPSAPRSSRPFATYTGSRADVRLGVAASSTSPGRGRRHPSRGGRTRRSYDHARISSPSGRVDVVVGPSDRQLPADVGLGLERVAARCCSATVCSAQPAPPANPGRLRNTQAPSTTRVLRAPSSSLLDEPLGAVVLPVLGRQLLGEALDALLVRLARRSARRACSTRRPAGLR